MTPEFAAEILKNLIFEAVTLAAPVLLTGMAIGLAVSLFQAVSSIHEQTLSFVPKALAVIGVLMILLPWLIRNLVEFSIALIQKMPQMTS